MKTDYVSNCGFYSYYAPSDAENSNEPLSEDFQIRHLHPSDAGLVNSNWEYKSVLSINMVREMINSNDWCALGVEERSSGELCAWILQYQDGPLGMLFCQEDYRRRGLSRALVSKSTETILSKENEMVFSYIVDGNKASESLFLSLGWKRFSGTNWVGYSSQLDP